MSTGSGYTCPSTCPNAQRRAAAAPRRNSRDGSRRRTSDTPPQLQQSAVSPQSGGNYSENSPNNYTSFCFYDPSAISTPLPPHLQPQPPSPPRIEPSRYLGFDPDLASTPIVKRHDLSQAGPGSPTMRRTYMANKGVIRFAKKQEEKERAKLEKDLKRFHQSRRKLVFDAANLNNPSFDESAIEDEEEGGGDEEDEQPICQCYSTIDQEGPEHSFISDPRSAYVDPPSNGGEWCCMF